MGHGQKLQERALEEAVRLKFCAKGTATQPQQGGGSGLISVNIAHDLGQEGPFDLSHHQGEEIYGDLAIEILKVSFKRFFYPRTQGNSRRITHAATCPCA
jgi:hypothetical protein